MSLAIIFAILSAVDLGAATWATSVPAFAPALCHTGTARTCTVSIYSDWGGHNWFDAAVYDNQCINMGFYLTPDEYEGVPEFITKGTRLEGGMQYEVVFDDVPKTASIKDSKPGVSFRYGPHKIGGPWECKTTKDAAKVKYCTSKTRFPCLRKDEM